MKKILITLLLMSGLVMGQARWLSEDKLAGWNFTNWTTGSTATISDNNTFVTSAGANGWIFKSILQAKKYYQITIIGSISTGTLTIFDINVTGSGYKSLNGSFSETFYFTSLDTYLLLKTSAGATVDITTFICKEVLLSSPIAKAKTNFVTTPPSSLNENGLVFAYEGNKPINKTIVDISGNGNNGTLNGGVMYAGRIDGGLQFDGVNDYVSVANSSTLNWGTGNGSIEMDYTYAGSNDIRITRTTDTNNRFSLNITSTTLDYYHLIGGTLVQYARCAFSPVSGKTYHIVISFVNGVSNAIYVDGVSQTLTIDTKTGGTFNYTAPLLLFYYDGIARGNGKLLSFKLYNVALTQQQVKEKFNRLANKIYIYEDFSDDTVGKFPRDWVRGTGTYAITELSTAESYLKKGTRYLNCTVAGTIAFKSDWNSGRISFDYYKQDASDVDINVMQSGILTYNSGFGYDINLSSTERIQLLRSQGGSGSNLFASAVSYIAPLTWYHYEIERTNANVWSFYIQGGAYTTRTLIGSYSETSGAYTTSKWFTLYMRANDRATNFKFYKNIPVQ